MAVHTGLTATCAGHLILLDRDEERKTAQVVVKVMPGHVVTGLEGSDLQCAADILMRRAQRFLGADWRVLRWAGPQERPGVSA